MMQDEATTSGGTPLELVEHKQYICRLGQDLPEIRDWSWPG